MKGKMYNASLLVLNQHWATNFPNDIIFRHRVKYFQGIFFLTFCYNDVVFSDDQYLVHSMIVE